MSEHTPDAFEPVFPDNEQDSNAQAGERFPLEPLLSPEQEEAIDAAPAQATLPPEAQGELNGGPLGCCLGVMIGLVLSLFLAIFSRLYATNLGQIFQSNYGTLGIVVRVLMALLAVVLACFCGYFGWRLGKRFYREYETPTRLKNPL